MQGGGQQRKARILCVHGFRQSASSFRGRTRALQRRLKAHAELVFVDGPYVVHPCAAPSLQPEQGEAFGLHPGGNLGSRSPHEHDDAVTLEAEGGPVGHGASVMSGVAQQGSHPQGSTKFAWLVGPTVEYSVAQHCRDVHREWLGGEGGSPGESCGVEKGGLSGGQDHKWNEGQRGVFLPGQHRTQTVGLGFALHYLRHCLRSLGPFDGALGFSQGAAVVAALAASEAQAHEPLQLKLKFWVLCSGFPPPSQPGVAALGGLELVTAPSLHIFGAQAGVDRQVVPSESQVLAEAFSALYRRVVTHDRGHIIPAHAAQCIADLIVQVTSQGSDGL